MLFPFPSFLLPPEAKVLLLQWSEQGKVARQPATYADMIQVRSDLLGDQQGMSSSWCGITRLQEGLYSPFSSQ